MSHFRSRGQHPTYLDLAFGILFLIGIARAILYALGVGG